MLVSQLAVSWLDQYFRHLNEAPKVRGRRPITIVSILDQALRLDDRRLQTWGDLQVLRTFAVESPGECDEMIVDSAYYCAQQDSIPEAGDFSDDYVDGDKSKQEHVQEQPAGIPFSVPTDCLKMDLTVNSFEEARHLLRTLRYWISSKLSEELISFCISHNEIDGRVKDPVATARDIQGLGGYSEIEKAEEAMERLLEDLISELTQLQSLVAVLKAIKDGLKDGFIKAAALGEISILRCLWEHTFNTSSAVITNASFASNICAAAAGGGDLECLKYAHEKIRRWGVWHYDTCKAAARGGHIECLIYAHEQGCVWYSDTCSAASRGGHLECLKYAHVQGCKWSADTCFCCSWRGSPSVFDCKRGAAICTAAAKGDHLECLIYAHEQGCDLDFYTCSAAAEGGQLECLKYAHEHDCDGFLIFVRLRLKAVNLNA